MRRACLAMLLAACSPAQPTPGPPPSPEPWQRSAIWIHATGDVTSADPREECIHVRAKLDGEAGCAGALCRHPAALASEWLDKCSMQLPQEQLMVSKLERDLARRAEAPPTKCAKQHARFLTRGCKPTYCKDDAQEWATRCAEREGSPLAVTMLARLVDRTIEPEDDPFELDGRSCATLEKALRDAARCGDEDACKAAWSSVTVHRKRCTDRHTVPTIATAVQTLGIAVGGARDVGAIEIANEPWHLEHDDAPLVLADGSGAVLLACTKRVVDLEAYVARRAACENSFVHFVRATAHDGRRRVEHGQIRISSAWDMVHVFPALAVHGEHQAVARRHATAIDAALADADALADLVAAVDAHADWLHTAPVRAALTQHDAKLVPLLEAAASAKVTAQSHPDAAGIAWRGQTRPLADVTRDGSIDPTEDTRARWLEPKNILPLAMARYTETLAPLSSKAGSRRRGKPAAEAAGRCAQAQKERRALEGELLTCVFSGCDESRIDELLSKRAAAVERGHDAMRALDHRTTGGDTLASIAAAAGCSLTDPMR